MLGEIAYFHMRLLIENTEFIANHIIHKKIKLKSQIITNLTVTRNIKTLSTKTIITIIWPMDLQTIPKLYIRIKWTTKILKNHLIYLILIET